MGDGPRGLQPRRRRVELLPARPRALARVPLGRGRDRRRVRRRAAAVPRARAVERRRPDPQGADVRADERRGQPRRGRQGVLVLRRQHADALVHEVRLQVPAGGVPVRRPAADERRARLRRPRVRAARHRRVRRRPLLRRGGRVREGGPRRPADARHRAQPRAGGGDAAPAADALVPQHVARRVGAAVDRGGRRRRAAPRTVRSASGASRRRASCCSATTRRTRGGSPGAGRGAVPEGRDQRPRDRGRRHGQPGTRTGTKVAAHHVLEIPAGGSAEVRVRLHAGGGAVDFDAVFEARIAEADAFYAGVIPGHLDADAANVMRQSLAGLLWGKQYYEYDVHRWLREQGVDPWGKDAAEQRAAQRPVVPLPRRRRDLDAGQVGVPVVRRLGPGLPLRAARARRHRLREGAGRAAAAHPLPAPERPDPGLRVELLRRQPAGHRVGGAVGLRARGRAAREGRPRVPRPRLRPAADQLHLVGQPQGSRRPQPVPGRVPRARQHRHLRPLGAAARAAGRSSRPTAPPGWPSTASGCCRSRSSWRARTTPTPTWRSSSSRTSSGSRSP